MAVFKIENMKENKLIGMVDFVIKLATTPIDGYLENSTFHDLNAYRNINEYAKFISQPLKLEMFIPVDDEGNELEKPNEKDDYYRDANGISENYFEDLKEYKKALDKVLFENVEMKFDENSPKSFSLEIDGFAIAYYKSIPDYWIFHYKTIQDLIPYNLILNK